MAGRVWTRSRGAVRIATSLVAVVERSENEARTESPKVVCLASGTALRVCLCLGGTRRKPLAGMAALLALLWSEGPGVEGEEGGGNSGDRLAANSRPR